MDVGLAEMIAKEQMTIWLDGDWKFRWTEAAREFGSCSYRKKEIALSRPITVLNDNDEVVDTILHEIAHALAGPTAQHGRAWQDACRLVGARPEPTYGETVAVPPARWHGVCEEHGVVSRRMELGKQFLARGGMSCSRCSPTYDARFMLSWVDGRTGS